MKANQWLNQKYVVHGEIYARPDGVFDERKVHTNTLIESVTVAKENKYFCEVKNDHYFSLMFVLPEISIPSVSELRDERNR